MRRYLVFLALLIPVSASAQPLETVDIEANAEDLRNIIESRTLDVAAVFQDRKRIEDVFAPSFLAAIPPARLEAIMAQVTQEYGAIEGIERVTMKGEDRAEVVLLFENATGIAGLAVDRAAPHLVTELLLQSFTAKDDSIAKIAADIRALPGEVSVLFRPLDPTAEPALSISPGRQAAIGSTFKLYVLSALARSIEAGERSWSDVVRLDRKSFPSGMMQDWPTSAPVTLQTLATMMIAISDNTATDTLMLVLGRDAVESELVFLGHSELQKTLPFLTTFEMFALKGNGAHLTRYIAADAPEKRRILSDLEAYTDGDPARIEPPYFTAPTAIDTVEWFASAEDIYRLATHLSRLDDPTVRSIMAVRTALPPAVEDRWSYIGYKGGSEPGVLNLTWLLKDDRARYHVLTMCWNDTASPVEASKLTALAERLLLLDLTAG